jgi:single-stranded DNA-binding protein
MTTDGFDGIRAELRGYVHSAPRVRFTRTGESLWGFGVRVVDSWTPKAEVAVVRVADQYYDLLQRWVVPGRRVYIRGTAHVMRWTGNDDQQRVRLLIDPAVEVMPLDREQRARGSEPAAFHSDQKMPLSVAYAAAQQTASPSTKAERAARVRSLLEEEPMP